MGEVTVRSEPMNPKFDEMCDISDALSFDRVVCWQVLTPAIAIKKMGHRNLVWVPMFDSNIHECNLDALKETKNVFLETKVICFCAMLYYQLQKDGFDNIIYAKYYPAPIGHSISAEDYVRPYFWQRASLPSWRTLVKNLSTTSYESLNLHWCPDDDSRDIQPPDHVELIKYKIRLTSWFKTKEEAKENLLKSNIYFAPRLVEGIGMSFLDAMAVGMPVIAMDSPTHNEYITHGWNGLLLDMNEANAPIQGLTVENIRKWSQNATASIKAGYEQWLYDIERIKAWLT